MSRVTPVTEAGQALLAADDPDMERDIAAVEAEAISKLLAAVHDATHVWDHYLNADDRSAYWTPLARAMERLIEARIEADRDAL